MHTNITHLALGHPECDGVTPPLDTYVVNALQESVIALRGFELTGGHGIGLHHHVLAVTTLPMGVFGVLLLWR